MKGWRGARRLRPYLPWFLGVAVSALAMAVLVFWLATVWGPGLVAARWLAVGFMAGSVWMGGVYWWSAVAWPESGNGSAVVVDAAGDGDAGAAAFY